MSLIVKLWLRYVLPALFVCGVISWAVLIDRWTGDHFALATGWLTFEKLLTNTGGPNFRGTIVLLGFISGILGVPLLPLQRWQARQAARRKHA